MDIEKEQETSNPIHLTEQVIQPWKNQLTLRGVTASLLLGSLFSIIAMKLVLTTGITPHLNVSAAFLAFLLIRIWTIIQHKTGFSSSPFTKQENTIIQTCVVACYGIASGGGFGSYLLGMNKKTFELSGGLTVQGNTLSSVKEPGIVWMISYLFLVCFIGLFVLIPLQKILIVDYKLTFPTGTATAILINGLHSEGDSVSKKQVNAFIKSCSLSFLWGLFQWFYTAKDYCGFSQFPTFGLQAKKQTFYFDFSLTYIGTGMICPHSVNLSLLLGSVISYGMLWPLIVSRKGDWFPDDIPESSMKSLTGYKVFISISLLLGDGLYNFVKISSVTLIKICTRRSHCTNLSSEKDDETAKKDKMFITERIPLWLGLIGYITMAIISVIAIPFIFPELKWYYIVITYIFAPSLAFCNAYGAGLMDINLAYNYGKLGLFIVSAIAGKQHGIIASMAACGLLKSIINVSCILMQDLKTGYLTLTSTKAMLISQAIGTALGCIVTPLSFLLFYKGFDIGNPNGEFKAPYALIYRNLAIVGVEGLSSLPRNCLGLCCGFFGLGILMNFVKDLLPKRYGKWVPLPAAMAVPFIVGGYFAIDMCVGSLVKFLWEKRDFREGEKMVPVIGSGFICGEGIWTVPASVLALSGVKSPICMNFLPASP